MYRDDFDDGIGFLPEDVRVIAESLWQLPAFTCRPVPHPADDAATFAATARPCPLVKPVSRLIFTPWVFGKALRTVMHA